VLCCWVGWLVGSIILIEWLIGSLRGVVGGNKLHSCWLICCPGPAGFTSASRAGSMRVYLYCCICTGNCYSLWATILLPCIPTLGNKDAPTNHLPSGPWPEETVNTFVLRSQTQHARRIRPGLVLASPEKLTRDPSLPPPLTLTGRLPVPRPPPLPA
jgi:hypothetical protein